MNMMLLIPVVAWSLLGQPGQPGQPASSAEKAAGERARAGVPRVLVMRDLSRRSVRLVSLGADQVQIVGARGSRSRPASVPRREVLAVLMDEAGGARGSVTGEAWLRTVWGEMIPGTLAVEEGEKADPKADPKASPKAGETLVWQTRRLGDLAVKLDEVAGLEFSAVAVEPGPGKAGEDRVLLSNGDVLSGFLEALGSTVVVEVGKQKREVALSGVARVEMSNPRKPLAGSVVWLTGGEVLRVTRAAGSAGETTLVREGKSVGVPTDEVAGWVEDAAVLRALAGMEPVSVQPSGKRAWAGSVETGDRAVPLGAADVTLPSPMVVTWEMPEGARRLSARVVLPAASRVWGDCVLVVEQAGVKGVGGRELARFHLSGDAPEAELNVEVSAGPVRVTLEEGENGPIQDRVMLRQPLVLVENK